MLAIFEGLKRGYVIYVLNYCSHRKKLNEQIIFVIQTAQVYFSKCLVICLQYIVANNMTWLVAYFTVDSRKNWMLKYKSYNFNVFILKRLNFSRNMTFPIKITKGGELNKEDVISEFKEEVTLDIQLYINICSSLSRRITHDIAFELF